MGCRLEFPEFVGDMVVTSKIHIYVPGNLEKELRARNHSLLQCCSVAVGKGKESQRPEN